MGTTCLKKEEEISLQLKTDSYALETNVHFPTDLNLLFDSLRKGLDMVEKLMELSEVKSWRKIKHIRSSTKSLFARHRNKCSEATVKMNNKKYRQLKVIYSNQKCCNSVLAN